MYWSFNQYYSTCINSILAILFCTLYFTTKSEAHPNSIGIRKEIIPDLGLSIVCLEDPYSEGWMVYGPGETNADNQYTLFVKADSNPHPNENVGTPFSYRLVVNEYPCFYEYISFAWGGFGTFAENSGNLSSIHEDGNDYPLVAGEEFLRPILIQLIERCNSIVPGKKNFPFSEWKSCQLQVSDILISNTTILTIGLPKDNGAIAFSQIMFVHGVPYFNGEEVDLW